MKIETLGAIDIGSNAIRLLVCNIETYARDREFKKLAFLRIPIRLGEDVFTQQIITPEKITRLTQAMHGFHYIMQSFGVINYRACATSAMREAANGDQVVSDIFDKTDVKIEIISGEQEADTIYAAGGLSELLNTNRNFLYVDVGGGSTEVVVYSQGQKQESRSFRLGTVRILSNAVDDDEFDNFKKWLKTAAAKYQPQCIIGSGGNINKVQRMLGKKDKETLCLLELQILYRTLKSMTFEERVQNLKLNTYRADVIIPALKIFVTVAKTCAINEIAVPRQGLADGIIYQLYQQHTQTI